jgi:hypothetical protein
MTSFREMDREPGADAAAGAGDQNIAFVQAASRATISPGVMPGLLR